VVILALACGCAARKPLPPSSGDGGELDRLQPSRMLSAAKTVSEPPFPALVEPVAPRPEVVGDPSRRYTLLFDKAPLGDVIAALTRESDFNLSVEAEIELSRPVTVHLKGVSLKDALDMVVVNGAGYAWAFEENTLFLRRFEERLYQFDYLDLVGETQIDVGGDMLGSGVGDSGVTGRYQITSQKNEQSSDVWSSVEQALSGLKSADGILRINRNAGVIFMADTPRRIKAMVRFLDSLTEILHRQVFIEARIMEVVLSDEHRLGIDWSSLDVQFTSGWGALPDVFELGFNNGSIAKANTSSFQAVLDFLRTQGEVKVLSNPHISVMNRQSALLTVGFQFPYTDIDGVDRDLETGVITIGTTIRRAVLGLQLGLTPQISAGGMITFHIVPTITRIEREVDLEIPTTGLSSQTITNPVIDLQELATTVRVRQGNSFVLAGLINKMRSIDHEGLPVLGSLPVIGELFKNIRTSESSSELVIFVTPYIRSAGG
jgi:type II secretory pathway component GspD/PulD (secretin)